MRRRRSTRLLVAIGLGLPLVSAVSCASSTKSTERTTTTTAVQYAFPISDVASRVTCRGEGASVVLLLHGTGQTSASTWSTGFEPFLRANGWRVCSLDLSQGGFGDIQQSGEEVVQALDSMEPGGSVTAVITHSQGALELRWAVATFPSVQARIGQVIEIGAPNHGSAVFDDLCAAGQCPPAYWQMRPSSAFIARLDAAATTVPTTTIYSDSDDVIQPSDPPTAALTGARNVSVQSLCPGRRVDHTGLLSDAVVVHVVAATLKLDGHESQPAPCAETTFPGFSPPPIRVTPDDVVLVASEPPLVSR